MCCGGRRRWRRSERSTGISAHARTRRGSSYRQPIHVDTDRPCINCYYNLRGLADTGTCPECGTSVELSTANAPLLTAPLEVRLRVRRGVFRLVAAHVLFMIAPLLLVLSIEGIHPIACGVVFIVAAGLQAIGCSSFRLPAPYEVGRATTAHVSDRRFDPVWPATAIVALLVLLAAAMILDALKLSGPWLTRNWTGFAFAWALAMLAAHLLTLQGVCIRVQALAILLGERELASKARSSARTLPLVGLLSIFFLVGIFLTSGVLLSYFDALLKRIPSART